jgi:acyl-coenzyme A thioesterase 13
MENRQQKVKSLLSEQLDQVVMRSPSPFMVWLAPTVREVGDGMLTFDYCIRKEMLNPTGTLHGGVTAAMMDDLIGATVITLGKAYFYTTINNVIDYFAGAKLGDIVRGQTKVIKIGRQIINVEFELWNMKKKRLLARGYSNLTKTELRMSDEGTPIPVSTF